MEKQSSSQSLAVMETSSDTETAHDTSQLSDQVLRAHFRHSRILGGAVLVILVIASIVIVLQGKGVTIESFPANEKTGEQIKSLLDYYNSITGSLSLFVTKPVDLFLGLFMAVAFLCLATNFTLERDSGGHWQYLPVLVGAALAFLFSNGLNSLNVQVTPGTLTTRIIDKDLVADQSVQSDQPLREDDSLSTTWNRSYLENATGNSVLNTILRTKLISQEKIKTQCISTGLEEIIGPITALPFVGFGFKSQPWQIETLATAVTTRPLKIMLDIKSASELPADVRLPSPGNVTSNLELIGGAFLSTIPLQRDDYLSATYDIQLFYGKTIGKHWGNVRVADSKYKWPPGADPDTRSYINASLTHWKEVLNFTANVSTEHASIDYNRIALSESIIFDAVTIELPIKKFLKTFVSPNETIGNYNMSITDNCSREGCVTPKSTGGSGRYGAMTIQPRVQVASICVNDDGTEDLTIFYYDPMNATVPCNRTSNNSMLVVSVGIRIDGDLWDQLNYESGLPDAHFSGIQAVYSITAGRLSWKNEDLAQAFGAECGSKDTVCEGLRFKMDPNSSTSDYLVVGKKSLPLNELNPYYFGRSEVNSDGVKWRSLVSSADGMGQSSFDMLLPRHFSSVTANGTTLKNTSADSCNTFVEDFINTVEKNHLYMEQSLQTSYTAAFYFLFQNAVRRKSLNISNASNLATNAAPIQLAFAGNLQLMNVQVSIPTTNAIVSLVGCFLLFITSLSVIYLAKRSEQTLQERANAEIVTEAIMNSDKYPPLLLKMTVEHRNGVDDEATQQVAGPQVSLQELRVQNVILQHKVKGRGSFHIGSEIEV